MGWRIPAAALCSGLGILINETTGEFPQKEQELFEGIVAVIAVFILTWMVFWMRKVSRNVKVQLEQAVDNALQKGNHHGWALIMMVFSPWHARVWNRFSSCWRHSSRMWASGRRWVPCSVWQRRWCWVFCSTGAAFASTRRLL